MTTCTTHSYMEKGKAMKSQEPLTLQDIIDFADRNGIPYSTPIGMALCDSEDGGICRGIVLETPDEACESDEENEEYLNPETSGVHCFFKGLSPMDELDSIPESERKLLMLTDGYHYHDD